MISLRSIIFAFIVFNQLAVNVFSMNASPLPFTWVQPDNQTVSCLHIKGSPDYHYMVDCDDYTVIQETIDGEDWLMYAVPDDDDDKETTSVNGSSNMKKSNTGLASSGIKVRDNSHEEKLQIQPNVKPKHNIFLGDSHVDHHSNLRNLKSSSTITSGVLKNLVILMRFQEDVSKQLPSRSDMDILFNHVGQPYHRLAPTGSIYDYYHDVSFGKLSIESYVVEWIDLPNTASYYAEGSSGTGSRATKMWHHALNVLENDPNFSFKDFDLNGDNFIDGITLIHSGYGAEFGGVGYSDRIWSHKGAVSGSLRWKSSSEGVIVNQYHISPALWSTSGSSIGRIGVIAHELGHFLGLPDLYDTDESNGNGIGSFCLMANSWGFDSSQKYPPTISAWGKIELGWLEPTIISDTGLYTIDAATSTPVAYRVDYNFPQGEYLLIENRQKMGYDLKMPQGGLIIYHIDETVKDHNVEGFPGQTDWPQNGKHYRVAVLQADGLYDLEKGNNKGDSSDVFHGQGTNKLVSSYIEIDKDTYPNTDPYRTDWYGFSEMSITQISNAQQTMSFKLTKETRALLIDGAGFCKSYRAINPLLLEYPLRKTGGKRRCSAYDTPDKKWEKCLLLCYPKCPPGYKEVGCNLCRKGSWWAVWRHKYKGRGWGKIHRCNYGEFIYKGECHAECDVGYKQDGGMCKSRLVYQACETTGYPHRCNEHQTVCSDDCSKIKNQQGTEIENKLRDAPLCSDIKLVST